MQDKKDGLKSGGKKKSCEKEERAYVLGETSKECSILRDESGSLLQ